jgi:hypothetical protein
MPEFKLLDDGRVCVPAGVYYVGDPVRIFGDDDDRWDDLMNEVSGFQVQPIGVSDDVERLAFPTGRAEGWFECEQGEVPVHTGLIGIVSAATLPEVPDGMLEIDIAEGETCHAVGGILTFGQIVFDTSAIDGQTGEEE